MVVVALVLAASLAEAHRQGAASTSAQTPTLPQAMAKLNQGDAAGAAPMLEAITAADPKNARAWRGLGVARHQLGRFDAAIEAYQKSLALEPKNGTALYNMGAAYARKNDPAHAFEWLNEAKISKQVDMTQIDGDTDLAGLKNDPRFKALEPTTADFARPFVEPTKILREWDGEAANDQFGWIARNIGDVDGDHVPDIVTSAPTHTVNGAPAGRIYIYSTRTGKRLWSADGQGSDRLGIGIEAAGDTNHDGIPDVIAAAPGGGYAHVYSGRDGTILLTMKAEDAAHDFYGRHAAGAGDVDHDGYADVIVGAPGNSAGGAGAGRAYVYSGKDGHVLLTLTGERAGDGFGNSVVGGDVGQGFLLIVGAPTAGPDHHGRAYVYDTLSSKPKFVVDADGTGAALGGMFVSLPGDVDGDGAPDVYVSDFSNTAKGLQTGRVYVNSGKDGHAILTLTGQTAGEGFGTSPSNAGDVDGDGHADFIVGAWQFSGAAGSGGRAYLYSGKDGHLIKTFTCRIPGDTFGFDSVTMGDVDGDGTTDFLITSAWSGIHGFHSGRVFLISSGVTRAKSSPHSLSR
jgi:hypothetical protein